jgi:cysteine synthase A
MPPASSIRSTSGRGRLFDNILETVGDTPVIRVNNLRVEGRTIYVKANSSTRPAGQGPSRST